MGTKLRHIFCALLALLLTPSLVHADGDLLFYGQEPSLRITTPDSIDDTASLIVTGAYSSADKFGIEGIALVSGILKSKRLQSWGGILVIDGGKVQIYPTASVEYAGAFFDLTTSNTLYSFIELAKAKRLTVLQSHLLINNSTIDLNYIHNAPKFVRRILFTTQDGSVGVWQSEEPETLYEATVELFEEHHPKMAFNLDMGAYDFCRRKVEDTVENCGEPSAGIDALTNVIEITAAL